MKSIFGVIATVALALGLLVGALLLLDSNPRIDAAQATATNAQTSATNAMTRANEAQATANAAHDLAAMANEKADAALAAINRGDPVAIVGIVLGCVSLGMFGFMMFVSGERNVQRAHDREMAQLRAGQWPVLPEPQQYYAIQTRRNVPLQLPPGKR